MDIGILSVQGAFTEHADMLVAIGVRPVQVRLPDHLDGLSGLILPGGESTTMRKLVDRWGLRDPILDMARRGVPILGTCAGMILLASRISDGDEPVFPLLDITVKRNAFGRQLDSFEVDVEVPMLGDRPVHGVFIRAPLVESVGPGVDVMARLGDGSVVAARQGSAMATAFHPELAGEPRFHRLLATMAGAFAEPAEDRDGDLIRCVVGAMGREVSTMPVMSRAGRVRAARITDLAAVGELSRMAHPAVAGSDAAGGPDERGATGRGEREDRPLRSLGLPVTASHVSVFSLFRMPLGAFQPHDQLYVYEELGRLAGLARVERDSDRDEWTIVELDAVDHGDAGDIRFRLVQHLVRDGSRRGAARFHVACADRGGNVEIFMQAGFARYGEETILYRDPAARFPPLRGSEAEDDGIRPANAQDALELLRLYRRVTPAPVARLEGYRLPDWGHLAGRSSVPRTSLTPILRFADIEAYVQEERGGRGLVAMLQLGVAKEQQPHYMRVLTLPEHDPSALVSFGLAVIGKRSGQGRLSVDRAHQHGVMSCVRTYESPLERRFEEHDMTAIASVSLLIKEAVVRVEEPSLVPAL